MNIFSTGYHATRYTSHDTGCCGCIVALAALVLLLSTLVML